MPICSRGTLNNSFSFYIIIVLSVQSNLESDYEDTDILNSHQNTNLEESNASKVDNEPDINEAVGLHRKDSEQYMHTVRDAHI